MAFASSIGNVFYKQKDLDKIYMLDPNGNKVKIEPIREICVQGKWIFISFSQIVIRALLTMDRTLKSHFFR
jgi:hypothetical protein